MTSPDIRHAPRALASPTQVHHLGGVGFLVLLLSLLIATAAHPQSTELTTGHGAVVRANAPTWQEPLVTGPLVSDLGHGVHVSTAVRVTPTVISLQTTAWRTRGGAVAHGAVGVSLIDAGGHVIVASGLHRLPHRGGAACGEARRAPTNGRTPCRSTLAPRPRQSSSTTRARSPVSNAA
jgi:hypothetical protein